MLGDSIWDESSLLKDPLLGGYRRERDVLRRILLDLAEGIVERTPFRRAVVTFYEEPVLPGGSEPKTRIVEYAACGLSWEEEKRILSALKSGFTVSGERYLPDRRIGDSYFYPEGEGLPPTSLLVPSRRIFIRPDGWHARDVLLVPLWVDGKITGQISVDDPEDGLRPSGTVISRLEEVAGLAALAIREGFELERITEEHRILRFLAESAMTGFLIIRGDSVRYVNARACEILGYQRGELLSLSPWWQVIHPDDRPAVWEGEGAPLSGAKTIRAIRRDGRTIWLAICNYELEYKGGKGIAVQFFDITERIKTEALLKEKALRDPLTGLLNRSYFEDAIQTELKRSKRYRRPLTLMMADLARFKEINDRFGHQEGDRVLVGISSVIRSQLRESDWVVRYGGDEFLFVLPETGLEVEKIETRLGEAIDRWCKENLPGVTVRMDFGWATWTPGDDRGIEELVRGADEMLYRKKEAQKDTR